jgi:hypothetical protein
MEKTNNKTVHSMDKTDVKSLEIPIYFHNYKLLEEKEFILKGSNIYFIQGPNKVGKTSFLKALTSLMIAQDDTPNKVTRGSNETEGYYETTIPAADGTILTIRHEFTADGKGKFFAINEDGEKISQVTEIRRLFNYTPINVSEFFAWSNSAEGRRKQRDVILKLLTDEDRSQFNDLDLQEQHYYEQRTLVNKTVEQSDSSIKAIVIPEEDEKLIPREKEARDLKTLYQSVKDKRKEIQPLKNRLNEWSNQIDKLEADLKFAKDKSASIILEIETSGKSIEKYKNLTDEDLDKKITTGEEIITKITSLGAKTTLKKELQNTLDINKKKSDEYTKKIEQCRTNKALIVSNSDLPVENISFEDGFLTIDGFQFKESQVCESDAVLILANILAKINKGPIQIIGDASILDAEKLEMLNKIAEDNNKVMFVDEVVRNADDMVVVGYEDLVKADLEQNFEKLDKKPKKSKKQQMAEEPAKPNEALNDIINHVEDKSPEAGEDEEASTLF